MTGVSLAELKAERCAQVSGADLLELSAQRRKSRRGLAKLLLVDVRPSEEYPFTSQVLISFLFYLLINFLCVSLSNFHILFLNPGQKIREGDAP